MDSIWTAIIWRQFGAAIDMLENAMRACPDELWSARLWNDPSQRPELSEFWYVVYHTLFWLDLYLSGSVEGFAPPAPFTLDELDPAGLLPERQYTRDELQTYLDHDRQKCRIAIAVLTDEKTRQLCKFTWGEVNYAELLLDNMRHVQEHGAQLNLLLGQKIGKATKWVAQTKSGQGSAKTMPNIKRIPTPYSYSSAVVAGNQVYLGLHRGFGDNFSDQLEGTLEGIKGTLAKLGLTVENLTKVNVWLKNIDDLPVMEKIFFKHFEKDHFPARMTATTKFCDADCLLMIDGIAYITD